MTSNAIRLADPLVRQFEGFSATPYLDTAGIWTIGYGCIRIDGVPVSRNTAPITEAKAEELLDLELHAAELTVLHYVHVPLADHQAAPLISFIYNEGPGGFILKGGQPSGMLRCLNAGDFAAAALEFPKWNMSGGRVTPGLSRRRACEAAIFSEQIACTAHAPLIDLDSCPVAGSPSSGVAQAPIVSTADSLMAAEIAGFGPPGLA